MDIAKLEYSVLTPSQKVRHGDPLIGPERETLTSLFTRGPLIKAGWVSHVTVPCQAQTTDRGDTVIYTIPKHAHRLLYTFMTQRLPALTVKKAYQSTYRIRWPRNVAHHIIRSGHVTDGSHRIQTLNDTFLDYHYELFVTKNANTERALGNIRRLNEWSPALPETTVETIHPWFYAQRMDASIPNDFDHTKGNLIHEYKVRSNVADLLEMQRFDSKTQTWSQIKPYLAVLRGITDGEGRFDVPKFYACLANRSELEMAMLRKRDGSPPDQLIEYLDMVWEEHPNTNVVAGDKVEFQLTPQAPCEAVLLGAQHVNPKRFNAFSNYTTSQSDEWWLDEKADNPIAAIGTSYGTVERMPDVPSIALASVIPRMHFPETPLAVGINAIAFSMNLAPGETRQTGIPLQALVSRIRVQLADPQNGYLPDEPRNPEVPEEEEEGSSVADMEEVARPTTGRGGKKKKTAAVPSTSALLLEEEDPNDAPLTPYRVFAMYLVQRTVLYTFDPQQQRYNVTVDSTVPGAVVAAAGGPHPAPTPMVGPVVPRPPPLATQPAYYAAPAPAPAPSTVRPPPPGPAATPAPK